jgi:ATP-dependent Clp protease protease subunit
MGYDTRHQSSFEETLIESRQLFLMGEVTTASADLLIRQAMYLKSLDAHAPLVLNIMSPGGEVDAGLAIIDVLRATGCEVSTVAYGTCASMAAHILACAGTHGRRYVSQNCDVLVHQLLSGMSGQQSDIEIAAEHAARLRSRMDEMLAEACGRTPEYVHEKTDRDRWLTAEEAVEFGLADHILGDDAR